MYELSEKGKEALNKVLLQKPYAEVAQCVNLLNGKSVLTEDECNGIINFIAQYPYVEVAGVLSNDALKNIFIKVEEENTKDESKVVKLETEAELETEKEEN